MCICDHGTVPLTVPHVHTTASGRALRRPRQATALRRAVLTGPWRAHDLSQLRLSSGARIRERRGALVQRSARGGENGQNLVSKPTVYIPQRVYDTISTQYTQLLHDFI